MTEKAKSTEQPQPENPSDTLIVPPPNFKERLLAAQQARAKEIRPSVGIPIPPHVPGEFPVILSSKIPDDPAAVDSPSAISLPVAQPSPKPEEIPTSAAPVSDAPPKPASTEPASGSV